VKRVQDSRFKIQAGRLRLAFFLLPSSFLLLAACSTPIVASEANLDPTAFIETRVVEILTQSAQATALASTPIPPTLPNTHTPLPPTPPHTLTPLPTRPLPTSGATITPPATRASVPSHTPATPCANTDPVCVQIAEHFWLERPIPGEYVYFVERTYPYGSTQNGAREPHHGVEFENRSGTPVIAAASGTVVVAGDDSVTAYGPSLAFYGNLVVVQLDETSQGQPVYNLYGHLSSVSVDVGQRVQAGDTLGAVGFTGVAIGPHLHFEVRVGDNDYASTHNPELWLKPLPYNGQPWGAIAGRVVDTNGNLITHLTVAIRPIKIDYEVQRSRFITTYASESLNGDDVLQENFAISDMPLGTYTVSVNTTKPYQQTITVEAGRITWVTFVVKPPYVTVTAPP